VGASSRVIHAIGGDVTKAATMPQQGSAAARASRCRWCIGSRVSPADVVPVAAAGLLVAALVRLQLALPPVIPRAVEMRRLAAVSAIVALPAASAVVVAGTVVHCRGVIAAEALQNAGGI